MKKFTVKIYLDDYRRPPAGEGYMLADNYADFLALVDKYRECIEVADLDYDLGYGSPFNGYHALKYMKEKGICPAHINVHSTHVSGRDKMLRYALANFPDAIITGWASGF